MDKPILCLDFDGVIHSYSSGWQGADVVSDPPVPGALDFLQRALEHFEVCIYSSRSNQLGGIVAMHHWLLKHAAAGKKIPVLKRHWTDDIKFPAEKPAAFLTIDDRALTFDGTWPDIKVLLDLLALLVLLDFKPWNKKDERAP